MSLYDYKCAHCGHIMEDVQQSIKSAPLVKCPQCFTNCLERIVTGGIMVTVKETKTIGSAIDKNYKKNKNKMDEAAAAQKEAEPEPQGEWQHNPKYRTATNKEVAKMTKTQRRKYVMTGKK